MKILFLYMFPLFGNGSGSFLRELSSELVKRGHEIGVVAPDNRKIPGVKSFEIKGNVQGVFVGHPEWPNAKKFEKMTGEEIGKIFSIYLENSLEAVEEFKPNLVHAFHTAFLPAVARVIKVLYGTRYIITTHGSDLEHVSRDRRWIGLINDANRIARHITANSDFTKKWYLALFGQELKRKTSVIVGGVNLSHYKRDDEDIAKINRKYNLTGKKVVLFTGRLTKQKGVIYLVRAAQITPSAIFLIVGDGPSRKTIEEEIKRRGIKNVVMAGYVPNTSHLFHAFYERADVYVSPSVWDEPLGLTILEAMAARTPVVATRKGGVLSIITDRVNGILIRPRNTEEIAKNLQMLLSDHNLRVKLGDQAFKTVVEKFSWGKIAQKFEKIYDDIVAKEKKSKPSPIDEVIKHIFLGEKE